LKKLYRSTAQQSDDDLISRQKQHLVFLKKLAEAIKGKKIEKEKELIFESDSASIKSISDTNFNTKPRDFAEDIRICKQISPSENNDR
jgi:hypothetical protein